MKLHRYDQLTAMFISIIEKIEVQLDINALRFSGTKKRYFLKKIETAKSLDH